MSDPKDRQSKARRFSPGAILETFRIVSEQKVTMNNTLPRNMTPRDRWALIRAGVIFGVPAGKRNLSVPVRLPNGWTKVSTEDPSIMHLVDPQGHVRATLFEKSAHTEVRPRFSVIWSDTITDKDTVYYGNVVDNASGELVHTTVPEITDDPAGSPSEGPFSDYRDMAINMVTVRAEAWLDDKKNYPHWRDASQYWD